MAVDEMKKGLELGTFKGVYIPSILTILGVILYMRMGWVVGYAGLFGSLVIITMASAITFITGLSISSTATNMEVKAGGIYFMISRSFGIEAGTAIGLPLYLAQALGISFYISGFSESIVQILPWVPELPLSLAALVGVSALAYYSPSLAIKTQVFIFVIIIGSILAFILGAPISEGQKVVSSVPSSEPFWKIFAVFFPAVTGIGAGVSMSGDLKSPHKSLPRGTIAAILTGYVVYVTFAILFYKYATVGLLKSDPKVIFAIAVFPPIIYLGIWFATLSSALGSVLGAPRTLQAMAQDKILPSAMGKGYGPTNNPRVATVITFLIAAGGMLIGGLDAIAPILSMFFLTSYGALNLIAGLEGMLSNPSWRPTFKTPWALSLLGAFACFGIMFMINSGSAFMALFFITAVYVMMKKRSLNSNWSDMRRGLMSYMARSSVYSLEEYEKDARSWRPNVLVITSSPLEKWFLTELSDNFCRGKSFLCLAVIADKNRSKVNSIRALESSVKNFINQRRVLALVKMKESEEFLTGAQGLISDYGLGVLSPNTVIFDLDEVYSKGKESVFQMIQEVHELGKNILFFREGVKKEGLSGRRRRLLKRIDIWWNEDLENSFLMLALAYMLQASPAYMRSVLSVKYIVDTEQERSTAYSKLSHFLQSSRIKAEVHVFSKEAERQSVAHIERINEKDPKKETDILFIGLRFPMKEETSENYMAYLSSVTEGSNQEPLSVFTMMGEKGTNFKEIFT